MEKPLKLCFDRSRQGSSLPAGSLSYSLSESIQPNKLQRGYTMPTLFAVYNLIDKNKADAYDQYLTNTKVPGIRGAPWCTGFNTWKIDKVLAPAVSDPKGELPSEPKYM